MSGPNKVSRSTRGITLTADQLNALVTEATLLDGLTATAAELNYNDISAAGTAQASKAVVLDASKGIATITSATITTLTSTTVNAASVNASTAATVTSAGASALAVGLAGATNPAFVVDSSTGSQAAGLKVTGATAAGTVAAAVISSGTDANLTINAKGAGTIGIGSASTGAVTVTPNLFTRGRTIAAQGAPAAKTVTAAITAAELVGGLITTTGATGPSVHQLPTGTLIDAELPGIATGDSFDFTIINTGTGASDDATITVNTDVTIIGNPTVGALTDATIISGSGTFRARRSAANTYVVYRIA